MEGNATILGHHHLLILLLLIINPKPIGTNNFAKSISIDKGAFVGDVM